MTKEATAGALSLGPDRSALRVYRDHVLAVGLEGTGNLIDVRSPAEFTGEVLAPPHLAKE